MTMETLKYKIVKSKKQYNLYCKQLDEFLNIRGKSKSMNEEIELLTVLIEKWDSEHSSFNDLDPVELIKALMNERKMKSVELSEILGVSKGLVSDILNYKKGLSKEIIRKLSEIFKVSHEAFNRHYELISPNNVKQNYSVNSNSRRSLAV